jgi:hypothetical protein
VVADYVAFAHFAPLHWRLMMKQLHSREDLDAGPIGTAVRNHAEQQGDTLPRQRPNQGRNGLP